MRVAQLHAAQDAEVTSFLDSLADSPAGASVLAYHYPAWKTLLESTLGPDAQRLDLAARDQSGRLLAFLPGVLKRSGDLACYNSLPFFGPNGGVLGDPSQPGFAAAAQALVGEALSQARQAGSLTAAFYSAFRPSPDDPLAEAASSLAQGSCPVVAAAAEAAAASGAAELALLPRTTLYLRLDTPGALDWSGKIRYDLRKAVSAGVTVQREFSPADIELALEHYRQNCQISGAPAKPPHFVRSLLKDSSGRVRAYAAMRQGRLIAALAVLWGPRTVGYYLPCVEASARSWQPLSLLIDTACRDAAASGRRWFNFESSPSADGGVWQFKRKWGSRVCAYSISRLCSREQLQALGPTELAARFPYFFVYPYSRLTADSPPLLSVA